MVQPAQCIKLRSATRKDADVLSRLVCSCYEGFARTDGFRDDVVDALKKTRGSVVCVCEDIVNQHVFLAEKGGGIKGMVSVKGNEITRLYIAPECQRRGLGRILFLHAESFIRDRGYHDLYLGAAGQSTVPFYTKMGMRIARKRKIDGGPCVGMTVTILDKDIG